MEKKKLDDDQTPGETFSMTITAALGKFLGTAASGLLPLAQGAK